MSSVFNFSYVSVWWGVRGPVQLERTKDDAGEQVLSFHLYMGSGDQTQVTRLVWQTSLPPRKKDPGMLGLTSENRVFATSERGVPAVTRCINGANLGDHYK